MTADSRQQKEKQSKAKGCLWVIAGVGFIVSVFGALAILGAVFPEPESQPVAQSRQDLRYGADNGERSGGGVCGRVCVVFRG